MSPRANSPDTMSPRAKFPPSSREDDPPWVEEDHGRNRWSNPDAHKSMGPDGMHPRVLRELVDVVAEPLSTIFERSWRTGEVPEDCRKASVTPKRARRRTQGTTGQSASPPPHER